MPDPATIDRLYGLEPVYEPASSGAFAGEPTGFVTVECPWCWERYETPVDLSAGSFAHVEDCQVCCRPIELAADVGAEGGLAGLRIQRVE